MYEHLAVDIDLSVDEGGGLRLRSGAQRFYEGLIGFRFPMLFSGVEWRKVPAGNVPSHVLPRRQESRD